MFSRTDISFDKTVMDNILQRPIMNKLDEDIAYSELCAILTKMQNHKSSGSNNLPMDALKVMSSRFSILDLITNPEAAPISFVYKMLNDIWKGSPIPEEWKQGNLSPIFKKGEATDPNNWRPVCLLDCTQDSSSHYRKSHESSCSR